MPTCEFNGHLYGGAIGKWEAIRSKLLKGTCRGMEKSLPQWQALSRRFFALEDKVLAKYGITTERANLSALPELAVQWEKDLLELSKEAFEKGDEIRLSKQREGIMQARMNTIAKKHKAGTSLLRIYETERDETTEGRSLDPEECIVDLEEEIEEELSSRIVPPSAKKKRRSDEFSELSSIINSVES